MPADVEFILREREALQAKTTPWLQDWQDIADLMLPGQSDIFNLRMPGTSRTRQLYDSTAMWALDTFVAHLSAWITNFQMQWFGLRMRALKDNQEAAAWLDDVAQTMYAEMVSDDAALATAVPESYRQYGGFGTGALFIDEQPMDERLGLGFRGYMAESLSIGRYYPAENAGRRVDTLYRDLQLSPHQAEQYWGRDTLHQDMKDALDGQAGHSRRYEPCDFVHAIYPRRGRTGDEVGNKDMPWASVWVDRKNKHLVHEGGYDWFPAIVYRWEKLVTHNPFGFGRGHLTLPESKTLQLIDRDALRALPMSILPPGFLFGAGRETIGRMSLHPGALNDVAAGGSFAPYTTGQRWDIAQLQIEERRNRVMRAFYIDQLQFLPDAGQRTQRTLGELQLRQRQMARIMGPALMRLVAELLNRLIDVTFATMLHADALPDPPAVVVDAAMQAEGKINVEYFGPLVMAQKDDEVAAILESVEFLKNLSLEMQDPLIIQNVALDETIARFLRSRGFPEALITDRKIMEEARAEAARQMQAQQEMSEAAQVASAARDAAPMLKVVGDMANAE